MNNRFVGIFFFSVVTLSVIGLAFLLFTDPMRLVRYIVMTAIVVGIMYLLLRKFILNANNASKDQRKFVKAARQSTKKLKKAAKPSTTKKKSAIKKRSASANHLTVIEGKKGKKKNRALH